MDMRMKQPVNQGCYIGTGDADYIRSHVLSQARSKKLPSFQFFSVISVQWRYMSNNVPELFLIVMWRMFLPTASEVWGKVMFLQVSVCSQGGCGMEGV